VYAQAKMASDAAAAEQGQQEDSEPPANDMDEDGISDESEAGLDDEKEPDGDLDDYGGDYDGTGAVATSGVRPTGGN
jgi:hypothetical protein